MIKTIRHYYHLLGPGLLSAGAAIGVSHLVQSTRAGADFGYQLLWVVIVANLIKYPFFEMAPRYTASTGKSLLHGYRQLGKWPLWVVLLMTGATMFTIQAAVTIVTAGIAIEVFGIPLDAKQTSIIILMVCGLLLFTGRYSVLDKVIKIVIIVLALTTIASLLGAVQADRVIQATNPFNWDDKTHLFFLVGLAGWMPAPLDLSVWHSIWMEEKGKLQGQKMNLKTALIDFNVGYIGTAILAMGFVLLGALVMYGSGKTFSNSGAQFAGQVIDLYTSALGNWSYPLIALAALTTMFSTTLTCFDAFPRVLREVSVYLFGGSEGSRKTYNLWLVVVFAGAIVLLYAFIQNMAQMVALATMLSFALAPVYAILNFLLMRGENIPEEARLSPLKTQVALFCILAMVLFSLWFIWLKYF